MKFAHEFREALLREGFPEFWVNTAVPYGQLKKCLNRVHGELQELGLEPDTLRQLLATQTTHPSGLSAPIAKYRLNEPDSQILRPRLTVIIQLDGGVAVDASLSPASREALQRLAASQADAHTKVAVGGGPESTSSPPATPCPPLDGGQSTIVPSAPAGVSTRSVEIPLVFDAEFFSLLQTDLAALETLQQEEEELMRGEVVALRQEISAATRPSRFPKTDLAVWRELFELYLEAQIFFSTYEQDHGARTSARALEQLIWFQNQVQARQLPAKFRLPGSHSAYTRFLALNATILKSLKFQEINQKAVAKILKKFDKRTSLGASTSFPAVLPPGKFMADNAAKAICSEMAQEVVSVVPRLEDYSCPVCMSIAWLPVRLACRHVFCVRCVIKMQREGKGQCPLCRSDVIMQADISNMDTDLEGFLKRYFREETKEKQKANEIERGIEVFGESYKHSNCGVM